MPHQQNQKKENSHTHQAHTNVLVHTPYHDHQQKWKEINNYWSLMPLKIFGLNSQIKWHTNIIKGNTGPMPLLHPRKTLQHQGSTLFWGKWLGKMFQAKRPRKQSGVVILHDATILNKILTKCMQECINNITYHD